MTMRSWHWVSSISIPALVNDRVCGVWEPFLVYSPFRLKTKYSREGVRGLAKHSHKMAIGGRVDRASLNIAIKWLLEDKLTGPRETDVGDPHLPLAPQQGSATSRGSCMNGDS